MIKKLNWYLKEFHGVGFAHFDLLKGSLKRAIEKFKDKPVVVCEVGVYKGVHAKQILKNLNVTGLVLIDPYENYDDYETLKSDLDKTYYKAKKYLKKYKQAVFYRQYSSYASLFFRPEIFDYVYIDGNHAYHYVKMDLENYYPLIKVGGILGGDDVEKTDVMRAVYEFAFKNNLKVNLGSYNWWIEK